VGHIVTSDDLDDEVIERLRSLAAQTNDASPLHVPLHLGLVFLEPSLRTRLGFATAAVRLGGTYVEVTERRWQPGMSEPESIHDVVRVVSGMTDVVVFRTPEPARDLVVESAVPTINGGDGAGEHPTQAVIDLVAMERFCGPVERLHVGICGDLRMRAARSLVRLLGRTPPDHLTLIAPPGRDDLDRAIPESLARRVTRAAVLDPSTLDVLYLPGLPEGEGENLLVQEVRQRYAVTPSVLARLPATSVVLSPMPVIDEIASSVRRDPRVRLFETTDLSVAVRMELLAIALGR
jgi:aspartate carbamoyltransferase catalytic subunit